MLYQPNRWEKMRSICSGLNYWSYIFNDKSCSAAIHRAQEAYDKKRADDPKEHPINVDPLWGSFTKTILRICFKWRCYLSYTKDLARTAKFYDKLLLHSKHFCRASNLTRVTSSTQQLLFQSSCFFRGATYLEQLLFRNTHFFSAIILSK